MQELRNRWGLRACIKRDVAPEHQLEIPPYNMLFFHGRLSHAGVGYAMRHSRVHCYIGDRRVERVLTPKFLDQSDLVDRNASLSWFDNNE